MTVPAPVWQVFTFMACPAHQVQLMPSLAEVWDVRPLPRRGLSARYTYRLAGLEVRGRLRTTEYRPGRCLAFALDGRVRGRVRWTFESVEGGTRFTYALAYRLPASLLRGVAESYLRAYNEREVECALTRLQARLENGLSLPAPHDPGHEVPPPSPATRSPSRSSGSTTQEDI